MGENEQTVGLEPATSSSLAALPRGHTIGRYEILEPLGIGGMGVVYRARDPELDRDVALKLLRKRSGPHDARLVREAQAMAALAHPNVLPVYDVGQDGGALFIAMELVEGQDLRQWHAVPRPWREVVDAYRQAALGLSAAHRAGIIHRDFKPDNVLIGDNARVRVLDFGLCRAGGEPSTAESPAPNDSGSVPSSLTQTGSVMGTPRYMAPEQHAGEPPDARTDEFALCASLYEGLYSRAAFTASDYAELAKSKRTGPPPAEPGEVPARLYEVVARGMAARPEDRFASIDDWVVALDRATTPPRRRWVLGALVLVPIAGLVVHYTGKPAPEPTCERADAAMDHVWSEERGARLGERFAAAHASGLVSWQKVEPHLSRYAEDWRSAAISTCQQPQDEATERRASCLRTRMHRLTALLDIFEDVDERVLFRSTAAVGRLPAVADCGDTEQLASDSLLPSDPKLRAEVEAARARIAHAAGLEMAGRLDEAFAEFSALLETVEHPPLKAEVLGQLGYVELARGNGDEAARLLRDAFFAAQDAGADDPAAAAAAGLVNIYSEVRHDMDQATRWAGHAEAILVRSPSLGRRRFNLLESLGRLELVRGDPAAGLRYHERSLALAEEMGEDNGYRMGTALANVGAALGTDDRWAEALDYQTRSIARLTETLGRRHPKVGIVIQDWGNSLRELGRLDEAEAALEEALEIIEQAYGPDHPTLALVLANLGVVASSRKHSDVAIDYFQRARALFEAAYGPEHAHVALVWKNVGMLQAGLGRDAEAKTSLNRAREIKLPLLGAEHESIQAIDAALAEIDAGTFERD